MFFQALAEVADGVTLPSVNVLCDCKSALQLCEVEYMAFLVQARRMQVLLLLYLLVMYCVLMVPAYGRM